jgi:hypothetical protein
MSWSIICSLFGGIVFGFLGGIMNKPWIPILWSSLLAVVCLVLLFAGHR